MVSTRTLAFVLTASGLLGQIDFLNIDVQGLELSVLKSGESHLSNIQAIYLEVNTDELYEGCAKLDEIDSFLQSHGFKQTVVRMTEFGWGDALYQRGA